MAKQQRSISRKYRSMGPGKFHVFNQEVASSLTNNSTILEPTWAGNPTLITSYLSLSQKHDIAFHEAQLAGKLAIAQRDTLQAQLVIDLDEIASRLEAAAVRNPEILLYSGFELVKERRGHGRHQASTVSEDSNVPHAEQPTSE